MVKIGVYAVAAVLSFSGESQRRPGQLFAIRGCWCVHLRALYACASALCDPPDRSRNGMTVDTGQCAITQRAACVM